MRAAMLAAGLLGLAAAQEPPAGRLREALLSEAKERLSTWYADKERLDEPFTRDGASVQLSKSGCRCGGDKVPLTFGHFDVEGARPVDVFNVLADASSQADWDPTVSRVKEVTGDWQETDGVRALEMLYPAGMMFVPDREVFGWAAYSADPAKEEFWVAFSSLRAGRIREAQPPASGAVPAQNCLGAYRILPGPNGRGARVVFTQQLNVHPPMLLSAKAVFAVSWGKQVDYINILRKRAQRQARLAWAEARFVLPKELLEVRPASSGAFKVLGGDFYRLFEEQEVQPAPHLPKLLGLGMAASLLLLLLGVVAGLRRRRWWRQEEEKVEEDALLEV